jgi:3-hydroxybutyryl-CoA dehydratase
MKGLTLNQSASTARRFSTAEVAAYRALTGDGGLRFGDVAETAVPGPLLAGMISDLLGTRLPGRGTNWLKQQLSYPAAAEVGEVITAVVTITRLRPEKDLVNLRTTCAKADGTLVCTGEALVYVKDLEMSES